MANNTTDVLLINPPWAELDSPSIQLSILVPIVRAAGFSVNAVHANLLLDRLVEGRLKRLNKLNLKEKTDFGDNISVATGRGVTSIHPASAS